MASSSQQAAVPPPNASPPSVTSTTAVSSPTSTTTASTITTANQASSTVSPPTPSTVTSSLSSPAFPPYPHPHPIPHPPSHHPLPHPNHAGPPSTTTSNLSPTLPPTISSDRQISEARQAVLASIGNMLDSSLRDRASVLHSNAAAIAKQERDVAKATDGLRKENEKLAKVARDAAKGVKELGNVQNWAEVLESDFLAIEETIRLVREGMDGGSDGEEGSWSGSWSGSGSESGDEGGRGIGGDGDVRMDDVQGGDGGENRDGKLDKGKRRETDERADDLMDVDGAPGAAGRSVVGGSDSHTGDTEMAPPNSHLPAVQSIDRDAPSIKVPGLEPSQTSTISLEDELRIAMEQPIGRLA
ncbi:hypothetical protein GE09DRAFT_52823 [Coniochaeta sp. 2T2.1]|nr:hypothetical protein GE09DRAFT_52823 [Coniochaeta sp. 2T2.1]